VITVDQILEQAAHTAMLAGDHDEDSVWNFAYATLSCDDDEPKPSVNELEDAFNACVRGASVAGVSIPEYILKEKHP